MERKAIVETLKPKRDMNEDNNVYYNIRITNRGTGLFDLARYSVNRVSPVLDNPNDYELAVVRFSIPATNIPIFVWGDTPYNPTTNPSSKVNKFAVSMTFDGYTKTQFLDFIPNTTGNDLYGNSIYNYQEFIDIVNVGLRNAFSNPALDGVKDVKPLAPPTEPPYLTYDAKTQLCSYVAQTAYDTGQPAQFGGVPPPPTINVYFNSALFSYFPSFQVFGQDEQDPLSYQIYARNNFDNQINIGGNPYYVMEQEFTTLSLWNDFTAIVFETDSIPVEPEYQPSQNDITRRLITDFEPEVGIQNREKFQYFGTGWKRYYDLKSAYPLSQIDIQAFWEDRDGRLYPIYIGLDESLTMKILFRKKVALQLENTFYPDDNDE
jgi:hypothetical protein